MSYRRAHICILDPDSLKPVPLRGFREELMETLNLIANGDIYQLSYDDIKIVFKNHSIISRNRGRTNKSSIIIPKYLDPGNPLVDVHRNDTAVPNTLIDLGVAINVMIKETILKLNL